MDAETSVVDNRDAAALLRQVMLSVQLALDTFEARIDAIQELDETLTDAQALKAITRLKEAFHALNRERQSFEKEFYGSSGRGGFEPLNLDDARAEVGRLLDRIRDRGGA